MKYHNKKTTYKGMTFDSKKELNRYIELTQLEKRGKISDLQRQVKFVLIPSQRIDGKVRERMRIQSGFYIQDGRRSSGGGRHKGHAHTGIHNQAQADVIHIWGENH